MVGRHSKLDRTEKKLNKQKDRPAEFIKDQTGEKNDEKCRKEHIRYVRLGEKLYCTNNWRSRKRKKKRMEQSLPGLMHYETKDLRSLAALFITSALLGLGLRHSQRSWFSCRQRTRFRRPRDVQDPGHFSFGLLRILAHRAGCLIFQ